MKMEELIGRLEESGNAERRALSGAMKRNYLMLKKEEDIDCRNKGFEFLNGCINTMMALGEITESEENELWKEIFGCFQREWTNYEGT